MLAVDEVDLDELTELDAERDGFDSVQALRSELGRLYDAESHSTYRAYRVCFELLR